MGSFRADLITLLRSQGPITDLVGERIYRLRRPVDTPLPAIVLSVQSAGREVTLSESTGVCDYVVRLDCLAESGAAAEDLADLVREAVHGFGGQRFGDTEFLSAALDEEGDGYVPPGDGSDEGIPIVIVRAFLLVRESIPSF